MKYNNLKGLKKENEKISAELRRLRIRTDSVVDIFYPKTTTLSGTDIKVVKEKFYKNVYAEIIQSCARKTGKSQTYSTLENILKLNKVTILSMDAVQKTIVELNPQAQLEARSSLEEIVKRLRANAAPDTAVAATAVAAHVPPAPSSNMLTSEQVARIYTDAASRLDRTREALKAKIAQLKTDIAGLDQLLSQQGLLGILAIQPVFSHPPLEGRLQRPQNEISAEEHIKYKERYIESLHTIIDKLAQTKINKEKQLRRGRPAALGRLSTRPTIQIPPPNIPQATSAEPDSSTSPEPNHSFSGALWGPPLPAKVQPQPSAPQSPWTPGTPGSGSWTPRAILQQQRQLGKKNKADEAPDDEPNSKRSPWST